MGRIAKQKAKRTDTAGTPWWTGSYVVARIDQDGEYGPGNVTWRKARSPHEAILGLEELDPMEYEWLPLTEVEVAERAALRNQNERRLYDIHTRMLLRCGLKPRDPDAEYVKVESTPFPVGWKPMDAAMAEQAQN